MADVSLDDLIKKDKEKDKVNRLKQVIPFPLRSSSPKSSSVDPIPIKMTDSLGVISLTRKKSFRNVLITTKITVGTNEEQNQSMNRRGKSPNQPNPSLKKRNKLGITQKNSFVQSKSWV